MIMWMLLAVLLVPPLQPPQVQIEALVDSLYTEALEELPRHAIVTRESVRIFYHIERPTGYWGVWLVVRYTEGISKGQIFNAGALGPPHLRPPDRWERNQ